jgi:photoactive yellow protein
MSTSQDPYSYLRDDEPNDEPDADASAPSGADAEPEEADPTLDVAFDDADVGEQLRHLGPEALNDAPFGIIKIDDDGVVQFYNRYESNLSGVDPEDALGTSFFTELAPCSNNPLFLGRFTDGVEEGTLDEHFTYTFTYKMRPTLVDVHLYRDDAGNNWILIKKR